MYKFNYLAFLDVDEMIIPKKNASGWSLTKTTKSKAESWGNTAQLKTRRGRPHL